MRICVQVSEDRLKIIIKLVAWGTRLTQIAHVFSKKKKEKEKEKRETDMYAVSKRCPP